MSNPVQCSLVLSSDGNSLVPHRIPDAKYQKFVLVDNVDLTKCQPTKRQYSSTASEWEASIDPEYLSTVALNTSKKQMLRLIGNNNVLKTNESDFSMEEGNKIFSECGFYGVVSDSEKILNLPQIC